jgi:hypothetical protein
MKRRSARPFVVEVKSTRSSRSSPAFARTRSGPSLWHGVALEAEAKPPEPEVQLRSPAALAVPQAAAQEPARRVLPALVPLYVPPEPEAQDGAQWAVARASRPAKAVRKPRARPAKVGPTDGLAKATAAKPLSAPIAVLDEPVSPEPIRAHTVPATPSRVRRHDPSQRHPELSRGERWKRRLPRACW